MSNWGANVLVSQTFPMLLGAIGVGGTFTIITGLMCLSLAYLYYFAVETKGMSLEGIDNMFRQRAGLEPIYREGGDEDDEGDADALLTKHSAGDSDSIVGTKVKSGGVAGRSSTAAVPKTDALSQALAQDLDAPLAESVEPCVDRE